MEPMPLSALNSLSSHSFLCAGTTNALILTGYPGAATRHCGFLAQSFPLYTCGASYLLAQMVLRPTLKSVSDMICTPQATGAMAAVFFYPCLNSWMNTLELRHRDKRLSATLIGFQVCFGGFLTCPVNRVEPLHGCFVALFGTLALAHCWFMLDYCARSRRTCCRRALGCAVGAFTVMPVFFLLQLFNPSRFMPLFYLAECFGLTAIVLFTQLWYFEDGRND